MVACVDMFTNFYSFSTEKYLNNQISMFYPTEDNFAYPCIQNFRYWWKNKSELMLKKNISFFNFLLYFLSLLFIVMSKNKFNFTKIMLNLMSVDVSLKCKILILLLKFWKHSTTSDKHFVWYLHMIGILFLIEPKKQSTRLLCYIYSLVLLKARNTFAKSFDHFNCQQLMHLEIFGY